MSIVLPKIGETITTDRALELCKYFNLDYLVERISNNKDLYKSWVFDGVSGVPDKLTAFIVGVDQDKLTYLCALPHDLGYAYGNSGDLEEKHIVDAKFLHNLIYEAEMCPLIAKIFFAAVDILGKEEFNLPFTWAFASK